MCGGGWGGGVLVLARRPKGIGSRAEGRKGSGRGAVGAEKLEGRVGGGDAC